MWAHLGIDLSFIAKTSAPPRTLAIPTNEKLRYTELLFCQCLLESAVPSLSPHAAAFENQYDGFDY